MIAISVDDMITAIDKTVFFENCEYSIFAVGYRGHAHFIAFLKLDNDIFEYDGMKERGRLRPVENSTDYFKSVIKDLSRRTMNAVMIWYKKSSVS